MIFFKTKIGIILTCAFLIAVITTTGVLAAQTISKTVGGDIEIVTVSGGGTGTTDTPNPANIIILKTVDFITVPNNATGELTGDIQVRNDTTADLTLVSLTGGPTSPGIGTMEVAIVDGKAASYPMSYLVQVGEVQTITIKYLPDTADKMPIGNYQYEFEMVYEY